jgi:hypothetical protein
MPGTQVVFPVSSAFNANGTADVNQVQQEVLTKLAANWELDISGASANAVFEAFSVAEGTSNSSADISVTYADAAKLKSGLKYALENATDSGSATLKTLLEAYVKGEVENDLTSMGLYNILEAELLTSVVIPNSTIGDNGSDAMDGSVAAAGAHTLDIVATQLPYSQYADISGGGNLNSAFAVGDSLVFHFTISSKLTVTPVNEDVTSAASYTGADGASASAGASAQGAFDSATHTRTINLTIYKV